jgi:uncharacterized protein (TIGR03000 family)
MNRKAVFSIAFVLTLVGVSLLGGDRQAAAHWYCGGSYWHSGGCCGGPVLWVGRFLRNVFCPYYAPYYSCGWSCGGYGCVGCYGCSSYYYSYPYYYDYGGYYGGYSGGWGYYDVRMDGRAAPQEPTPATRQDAQPRADETTMDGRVLLNVSVPADAEVYVNGRRTTSSGRRRRYVARNVQPGLKYKFEVRAELVRGGEEVSETKTVALQANQTADLAFRLAAQSGSGQVDVQPPRTSLTVRVPAAAKVWLEGNATRSTGTARRFATTGLAPGQVWEDYEIRVELERDGRTRTRQQNITLKAGQSHEIRFDFAAPHVAGSTDDQPGLEVRAVANKF